MYIIVVHDLEPHIVKFGKIMKMHIYGILESIGSHINSAVGEWLNNRIGTAFKW